MSNELLLIFSIIAVYSTVLIWYAVLGNKGLMIWTAIATISANIGVLVLVDAFGISQTLGNVLFASTFLVTDILSEVAGKKEASKAVKAGILTSLCFIIISQYWLLYSPNAQDWAFTSISTIFTNTPRIMLAGLLVYAICQSLDVWLYHKWWDFTEKKLGTKRGFLWLRNNGSTLVSQFLNTLLFTLFAFYGTYENDVLLSIFVSTFVIYIFTSLLDTPFVYLARMMKEKNMFNCCEK